MQRLEVQQKIFYFSLFVLIFTPFFLFAQNSTTSSTTENARDMYLPSNIDTSKLLKNDSGTPIISSEQVGTEEELDIFDKNLSFIYTSVSNVITESKENGETIVTVNYKHPGKFLNLFPVSYQSINSVTSTNNGIPNIDSQLSFWSSLISDKKYDRSLVVSKIISNDVIRNQTQPNASPASKARVAEAIVYELNQIEKEISN